MKEFILLYYAYLAFGISDANLSINLIPKINIEDDACIDTGNSITNLTFIPNEYFCFQETEYIATTILKKYILTLLL